MYSELEIREIILYRLSVPLKEPFITSLGREDSAENIVVKITTDKGITGFGECSPFMPVNGESQDTCFTVGQYFAKFFLGKNALTIAERVDDMDSIIYGNSSIKSAFDMALYDIASQNAGLPLYQFLGGKNNKQIATDYTVSIGDPRKMAADAVKLKEEGYAIIKVKLGRDGTTDVERIKAIRTAIGNDIPLSIDANQGWTVQEAIETLQALAGLNILHCEEPIPRWDFMNLPQVKRASPIPIMADESCSDAHDAERLLQLDACDMINIKIGKAGGIYKALKIVDIATKKKMPLQTGAFMESRLAMTAFAHFALCSPLIRYYDFDTALMFREDPVEGGILYERNGMITLPEVPGLGASIPESRLANMEKVVI